MLKFDAILDNKEDLRKQLYESGDKNQYVHIHLHSDFSLKDGIGKPTQFAKLAIDLGMPAIAITDHGSVGSHPSFFMFCRSKGIKPIVGVEAYLNDRRSMLKEVDDKLTIITKELKSLKSFLGHKRISKRFINNSIEMLRMLLDLPDATYEDIAEYDFSEIKELVARYNKQQELKAKGLDEEKQQIRKNAHILLLAKNETGRRNITKIVSDAAMNGFYYKPRTEFEFIEENKEGIIVCSACMSGVISRHLRDRENIDEGLKKARRTAEIYKEVFGDDFYIEIMLLDLDDQRFTNKHLIAIAKELDIKLIVTNDVHYPVPEGAKAQEISLMLGSKDETGQQVTMRDKRRMEAIKEILTSIGKDISHNNVRNVFNKFMELDRFSEFRQTKLKNKSAITVDEIISIVDGVVKFKKIWSFSTKELFFKDRHKMIDTYIDSEHYEQISPEVFVNALDNTLEIANKVETWDWDSKEKLPKVDLAEGQSSYDKMVELVREGWTRKAKDKWYEFDSGYVKRIKHELSVIRKLDLADYFLIVADYIKYAKNNNVVVGAARGSAAGSLVCYLLDITNIDPIPFGLLFERFLSMSRSIAIYDFEVPDYSIEKHNKPTDVKISGKVKQWYDNNRLIKLEE